MASSPLGRATIILSILLLLIACSPDEDSVLSTDLPPTVNPEVQPANLVISSASLEWPEIHPPDPCLAQLPSPTIHLCIQNQGSATGAAEYAYVALPAGYAPAIQANILGSLPGGNWKPAEFIPVEGLPGAEGSTQGIIIVNSMPGPDTGAEGIIIINNMPGAFSGAQGIIIVDTMPGPDSGAEGIIIINGLPGVPDFSLVMGIVMEDKPDEDGSSTGIIIVNSMPVSPSGTEGIVWGGIVWGGMEGSMGDVEGLIPLLSPPSDDNLEGIVWGGLTWGGMPAVEGGTQGIIVVDSMPGPESGAEGIIIIDSMPGASDISQVMGIIMEDKPGEDGSSAGIVIVNGIPVSPSGTEGIVWGGIVWGGMEGLEGETQGIIVQNMPGAESGAESAVWTGMPFGFEMGEGMMAMMGEGGFGPGPYLLGRLELSKLGFPPELDAGEEGCIQVAVLPNGSESLGGPNSSPPADSFFDVFIELDTSQPQSAGSASGAVKAVQVSLPSIPVCTPTTSPTHTNPLPTATPTRPAPAPPANTPTYFRPSPTPQRYVPTPTLPPRS